MLSTLERTQVSLMEIYNETIRDLIDPKDETGEVTTAIHTHARQHKPTTTRPCAFV